MFMAFPANALGRQRANAVSFQKNGRSGKYDRDGQTVRSLRDGIAAASRSTPPC
jgi:hypothetical protein